MLNLGMRLIGSIALPLIMGTFSLAALIGTFCTSFKACKQLEDDLEESKMENGGEAPSDNGKGTALSALRSMLFLDYDETDSHREMGHDRETQIEMDEASTVGFLSDKKDSSPPSSKKEDSAKVKRSAMKKGKEKKSKMNEDDLEEKPRVSFSPAETVAKLSPIKEPEASSTPETDMLGAEEQEDEVDGRGRLFNLSEMSAKERAKARAQTNRVFMVLFTACFVVYVWRHPLLVLLFIPFGMWSGLKYTFNFAVARNSKLVAKLSSRWSNLKNGILTRKSVLFPSPIPTIIQIYLVIDKKILNIIRNSIGSLLTTFIIVSLLIGVTAVTVMLLFEIQVEVMHYVTSALAVWNSTVADSNQINELVNNRCTSLYVLVYVVCVCVCEREREREREICFYHRWMGVEGNETTLTVIERFAKQNYDYGREWLISQVNQSHNIIHFNNHY